MVRDEMRRWGNVMERLRGLLEKGEFAPIWEADKLFQEWSAPWQFPCNKAPEIYLNKVQFFLYKFQSTADH